MILSIGEILIDKIESVVDSKTVSERHCGGAPFNVIYNSKKSGADSAFIGAVGTDGNGKFLIDFAKECGLDYLEIQEIDKPTTIALVTNDSNGERYFRFIRDDSADYQISFENIDEKLLEEATIIHLGSLMLSEEVGRNLADRIVEYCKAKNKLLSFDVNFRSDIFKDKETAKSIYKKYIDSADILKLSEDELELFTGISDFCQAVEKISKHNQILTITLGSKGSYYRYNDFHVFQDTIKVKPVDTTGAGDAFYGTFLALLDKTKDYTDPETIGEILRKSNEQGALTTLFKGAIK